VQSFDLATTRKFEVSFNVSPKVLRKNSFIMDRLPVHTCTIVSSVYSVGEEKMCHNIEHRIVVCLFSLQLKALANCCTCK
jgi:hypothetical protein